MKEEISRDVQVRQSSVGLWSGILAGPIAWAVDLQLRYALVPWSCKMGRAWLVTFSSVPLLIVALIGAALSWRAWSLGNEEAAMPNRVRFMALGGLMLSAFFALSIIAATIPDFYLSPCD